MSSWFSEEMNVVSFWAMNRDSRSGLGGRSVPPSHRPSVSPPVMTSVPFGARVRRRRASEGFPPMSRITW
jgi:hypothetical protein